MNAIDLFNAPEEALGKGITINNHIYEVIGVIDENSIRNNAESNVDNMYYGDMNYIYSYMHLNALSLAAFLLIILPIPCFSYFLDNNIHYL